MEKYFALDAATGLIKRAEAQAALTSDGYVGTQHDQGGAVATDMVCVINLESLDIGDSDETATFRIVGSNETDRSDGEVLGMLTIGDAAAINIETRDAAVGDRYVIRFRTEKNDTRFRYVDLHLDVAGTGPSFGFSAFFSKEIA